MLPLEASFHLFRANFRSLAGMGDLNPDRLAGLAELLRPLLGDNAKAHVVPASLSNPSYLRQATFNVEILNLLEQSKKTPAKLEEAIQLLAERNSLLTAAQSNPDVFALFDQCKALKSAGTDPSGIAMLLAASQSSKNRKRPAEDEQPFRTGGASASRGAPRSRRSPSPPRAREPVCFSCGLRGHFRQDCRNAL